MSQYWHLHKLFTRKNGYLTFRQGIVAWDQFSEFTNACFLFRWQLRHRSDQSFDCFRGTADHDRKCTSGRSRPLWGDWGHACSKAAKSYTRRSSTDARWALYWTTLSVKCHKTARWFLQGNSNKCGLKKMGSWALWSEPADYKISACTQFSCKVSISHSRVSLAFALLKLVTTCKWSFNNFLATFTHLLARNIAQRQQHILVWIQRSVTFIAWELKSRAEVLTW